jgi:hypothetical protein
VAGPPELDGAAEEMIEAEAAQLLQRVVLASSEDVPDVEIIEVVTKVEEWFSNNSADDNSVSMNAFSYGRTRSPCSSCRWAMGRRAMLAGGPASLVPSCSAL